MRAKQNLEAATVRLSTEFDARLASLFAGLSAIDLDRDGGAGPAVRDGLRSVAPGFIKDVLVIRRAPGGA